MEIESNRHTQSPETIMKFLNENPEGDDWASDFSTNDFTFLNPVKAKFTRNHYETQLKSLEKHEADFHSKFEEYKKFNPESEASQEEIKKLNNIQYNDTFENGEEDGPDLSIGVQNWKKFYQQDDMEILYDPIQDIELEDRYVKKKKRLPFEDGQSSWKYNLDSFGALNCSYCFCRLAYSNFAAISYPGDVTGDKIEGFVVDQTYDTILINMANPRIVDSNIQWYKILTGIDDKKINKKGDKNTRQNKFTQQMEDSEELTHKQNQLDLKNMDLQQISYDIKNPDMVFDVDCKSCLKTIGEYYFDKKVYFIQGAIEGTG